MFGRRFGLLLFTWDVVVSFWFWFVDAPSVFIGVSLFVLLVMLFSVSIGCWFSSPTGDTAQMSSSNFTAGSDVSIFSSLCAATIDVVVVVVAAPDDDEETSVDWPAFSGK